MAVLLNEFLTSALNAGASRPSRFTSGETAARYPLDRRLGGPQSQSGPREEEANILPLPGIEPRLLCIPASTSSQYAD
jgi:hypothetical protein